MNQEINITMLLRGKDRYIFLYTNDQKAECLRRIGKYANNPELNLTWHDAAILSKHVREQVKEPAKTSRF